MSEPRRYRYARKAIMFGDGGRGMRLQLHGIFAEAGPDTWVPTGILVSSAIKKRGDEWTTTVELCGEPFPSFGAAIDAYEATLAQVAYG